MQVIEIQLLKNTVSAVQAGNYSPLGEIERDPGTATPGDVPHRTCTDWQIVGGSTSVSSITS